MGRRIGPPLPAARSRPASAAPAPRPPLLLPLLALLLLGWPPAARAALDHEQQHHEWLIGWRGESYRPPATATATPGRAAVGQGADAPARSLQGVGPAAAAPAPPDGSARLIDLSAAPAAAPKRWSQVLSWSPRLRLHHNFLSPEEADALVALSQSVDPGAAAPQQVDDRVLSLVEDRISNWTALPPAHAEGWALHRGFAPEERSLHLDLLTDRLATEDFQRLHVATVLLFLGDSPPAAAGGRGRQGWRIAFPRARGGSWRAAVQPEEYPRVLEEGAQVHELVRETGLAAARQKRPAPETLAVAPPGGAADGGACGAEGAVEGLTLTGFRKGSALLIYNVLPDGQTPDAAAAHVVCGPDGAGGGEAAADEAPWVATTWLRDSPARQDDALELAATCVDQNPSCRTWAAQGFCDDAPGFMLGLRGKCRFSCQDCHVCQRPSHAAPTAAGGLEHAAAPVPGAADASGFAGASSATASAGGASGYAECLYANMHSLRQGWSEQARSAGVRRARNAIRRELRLQQEAAAAAAGAEQAPPLART